MQLIESALEVIRTTWREKFGGNYAEAAEFFGVQYQTFYAWLTMPGRVPSWRSLAPALEKLNATIRLPDEKLFRYSLVKKVVAKAGAGSSLETSEEVEGLYAFREDFFNKNDLAAASCVLLEVFGDSMLPTLRSGDLILVDTSDTNLVDGRIFLIAVNDELLVKRVFRTPHGIILRSDNRDFPDMPVTSPDLGNCIVRGRVRWVGKEL